MQNYESIILLVVLYGCETASLKLWDGHKVRVFKNRAWGEYVNLEERQ